MPDALVLPFRGVQFSFSVNSKADPVDAKLLDLSCCVFDRQGQFLDVVHAHKHSALMGAICAGQDPSLWPAECQAVPGDDVVHVLPKLMSSSAEVLVLVASVPKNSGKAQHLGSVPKLDFTVTFASEESNTALTNHVTTDFLPTVSALVAGGTACQSIILAVVYLDQPGWTVRHEGIGSAHPSWSLMLPELQAAVVRVKTEAGVSLDAASALQAAPPSDTAILPFNRQFEDQDLNEAASFRLPDRATVSKMRLDVGWKFWKSGPEDEIEGAAVEFVVKFFNAQGEEVQSAGTNEREATGVTVGRPEPEEEEEAEPEAEPEEEAEAEAEEDGEEEEGAEPKAKPPPPPQPAEDPYEFKLRDVAFIDMAELPKEVCCIVVVVANYGEVGFGPLRHAGVKLWDISGGEEGARPLAEWQHLSKFEAEVTVTQVVMLKVYKEYDDSAWNMWVGSGCRSVGEFVDRPPEDLKATLMQQQARFKEFKAMEVKALAEAEESGEELTRELRTSSWRLAVLGLALGGESLEAAEHDMRNVRLYEGTLQALTERTCDCARVQFNGDAETPRTDTYFGGYRLDYKSGPGIYCFSSGAFYVGHYEGDLGKRAGSGLMLLPDGGIYEGGFKADRFHGTGQYRYPDGSVYTGEWEAGLKHGEGVYWDTSKGCLQGTWEKGVLAGKATYDQPAVHYEGAFVAGVPAGPGYFTVAAHRTLGLPKFAAAHLLDNGPTLRGPGEYTIPAGSGDPVKLDEDGNPIEDPDKPLLPAFPKYEGLTFVSTALPMSVADAEFPPKSGLPVRIPDVPAFVVPSGLSQPTYAVSTGLNSFRQQCLGPV